MNFEYQAGGKSWERACQLRLPKLTNQEFSLRQIFPDLPAAPRGTLRVDQPKQFLFFGRMLVGQKKGRSFSANHSYYDTSSNAEYWSDTQPSARRLPYLSGYANNLRFYPVQAPSRLAIEVEWFDARGKVLGVSKVGTLVSPGPDALDIFLERSLQAHGLEREQASSYIVRARDEEGRPTPARVSHQFVIGDGGLEGSVALSLFNPNVAAAPGKKSVCWGQLPLHLDFDSWLCLLWGETGGDTASVEVDFFSEEGKIAEDTFLLAPNSVRRFLTADDLPEPMQKLRASAGSRPAYVWYFARSPRRDLTAYSGARHLESRHCSAEHSF